MEPANLNPSPPPPDDAPLETWLRSSAARPPLPDDGFTARVLGALPPAPAPAANRRRALVLAGTLAGAAVLWAHQDGWSLDSARLADLAPACGDPFGAPATPAFALALALVLTLASLLVVYRPRWRLLAAIGLQRRGRA